MSVRDSDPQTFAAQRPWRRAILVDAHVSSMKDEALGVEIELSLEPVLAPLSNVGTLLLSSVRGLFTRDAVSREEPLDRTASEVEALHSEAAPNLLDCRIPFRTERRQHSFTLVIDAS